MLDQIKSVLKNQTRSLEIYYVLNGLKPCCRIAVSDKDCQEVETLLHELSLHFDRSVYKISLDFDGSYSTKGKLMPGKTKVPGYYFYYISRSESDVKSAREAEEKQDHRKLGKLLGYPECCTEFFFENHKEQEKGKNDYVLPALKDSFSHDCFPFENNIFLRYFDIILLSHSPCSFNCNESRKLAARNLKFLEENQKKYYDIIMRFLKTSVIYGDEIVLLEGKREKHNEFIVSNVISSSEIAEEINRFMEKGINRITFKSDFNSFKIDDKEFKALFIPFC